METKYVTFSITHRVKIKTENNSKSKEKNTKFSVSLPQKITNGIKIYCKTIEIEPKQFIRDSIVKDLIRTYIHLQSEDYIYVGDKFPGVKKPLKKCLVPMKLAIEIIE